MQYGWNKLQLDKQQKTITIVEWMQNKLNILYGQKHVETKLFKYFSYTHG